uniref:Antimicrobial peptide n=1 Tax=Hadrurus spadix TaxID=141984 RepID=A0A1W7RAZ9_9SCOR
MNAKVFLVVFMIALFVTEKAEAGILDTIKSIASKVWNSKTVQDLKRKGVNWIASKLGVSPQVAASMTLDEIMDALENY